MSIQTLNQDSTDEKAVPDWDAPPIAEEQVYRAGAYRMLAALLRDVPREDVLTQVSALADIQTDHDELALAMSMLGLAARDRSPQQIDDEFHNLFIGLGRGELVPYASWYLTGFLMEKPLALLRGDLAALGFERNADIFEPEDHVAALCEVMDMLISENKPLQTQIEFFQAHMANWVDRFYQDLSLAKQAVFYRAVGRFGTAFFQLESDYLAMKV
ncbi:MAG: molecular chaperone TorD family protein [Gammaproteobacteria bacterium]|jgi:TorA maturation chaperone TorD